MPTPIRLAIAAAGLLAGSASAARAIVLTVPTAYPTIASAMTAAAAGDTVLIDPGAYPEHDLILKAGVTLRGSSGDPLDVTIDGQRAGRCLYGAGLDAATRIEAVTLTNGLPTWGSTPDKSWGGGLYVDEGSLKVTSCIFLANEAAIGGGAFVRGTGAPIFEGCLFLDNKATESAGLNLIGTCDPSLLGCTFRGGRWAMAGGGVTWGGSGTALLENCTVEENSVMETGGGVEVIGAAARATLRGCLVRGNSAGYGAAGLYVGTSARVTLEDCVVTENAAQQYAGGVDVDPYAVLAASYCTILGNTAPLGPDGTTAATSAVTFTCCDVDLDLWNASGAVTVEDEGCAVASRKASWGEVKSLFR